MHHDPQVVKLPWLILVMQNRVWHGSADARSVGAAASHERRTLGAMKPAMTRKEFRQLVTEVLATLPRDIASRIENVEVVVEDEPTAAQIRGVGLDPQQDTLFGLYEGVPLHERGHDYAALPDKISIFYLPIIESCTSIAEVRDEIRTTVLHEVAHFFGIGDDDLDEWGY
ncbi:MAG: metallopeptidase family protein [Myxococcales bacterium]|nr:metallopeptidase family protein [Myxococcales bacterium]